MKDGGEIYFKTDDDDLFRDSLEYFPASGYDIEWMTFDLHENEPEWNIRTEHEGMFTEMGIKIKALIARKKPGDDSVTWIEPKVLKRRHGSRWPKPLPRPHRKAKAMSDPCELCLNNLQDEYGSYYCAQGAAWTRTRWPAIFPAAPPPAPFLSRATNIRSYQNRTEPEVLYG